MSSKILRSEEDLEFIMKERFSEPNKFADYKGTFLPKKFCKFAESIENFQVRDDDIWLCSFPRSGKNFQILYMMFCFNIVRHKYM